MGGVATRADPGKHQCDGTTVPRSITQGPEGEEKEEIWRARFGRRG